MRKLIPLLLLVSAFPLTFPLTAQTPYLVKDINATVAAPSASSAPGNFVGLNGRIFFTAYTAANGLELWSTDETSAGTSMVADINPGTGYSTPSGLTVVNNLLVFAANDGTHGVELWATDGTAAGTQARARKTPNRG
jgi:ELWxxDGT repeat protein